MIGYFLKKCEIWIINRVFCLIRNVDKIWIFSWNFTPPPVASALALVFREQQVLNPSQLFAFSAETHLDIAKNSRNSEIPTRVGSIVR